MKNSKDFPYLVEISHKAYYGKHEFYNRYNNVTNWKWSNDGKKNNVSAYNHGLRKEINQWIVDNTDGGIEDNTILYWRFKFEKDAQKFIDVGFGSYEVRLRDLSSFEKSQLISWYVNTSLESIWRGTHFFNPDREIKYTHNVIKFDKKEEAMFCKLKWG
jgi:hypothetical protein